MQTLCGPFPKHCPRSFAFWPLVWRLLRAAHFAPHRSAVLFTAAKRTALLAHLLPPHYFGLVYINLTPSLGGSLGPTNPTLASKILSKGRSAGETTDHCSLRALVEQQHSRRSGCWRAKVLSWALELVELVCGQ